MPPKRTRAKKSVKQEVDDDLPSFSTLKDRRVDVDDLFAPILHVAALEFGDILKQNLTWISDSKEHLKQICIDFGGAKTVPKTPKRETAFSKIKDTINMFDNLALAQVPQPQRTAPSLEFDNVTEKEDDKEREDEIEEEETTNENTEREMKTDGSPVGIARTPIDAREIKEEVLSERVEASMEEEEEEIQNEPQPRRGRSRKIEEPVRTPARPIRTTRSSRRNMDMHEEGEKNEQNGQTGQTQTRVHTPSRVGMGGQGRSTPSRKAAQSPARGENAAGRGITAKAARARGGMTTHSLTHSSINSSPARMIPKNGLKGKEKDELERAVLMKKLEEKGKTADANREEGIRERAERIKREREERELKVRMKKEEEEKKIMKKRMEMAEREKQANEMRKRQAQSPSRNERAAGGARTPTRIRLGNSPDGRLMKRPINSPLTPRVPVKQHRQETKKAIPMMMNESEDDETEREKELKRMEMARKKRQEEELMRQRKIREEEERVARMKEDERRRDEERRREKEEKERREMERQERERREREKEEKEKRMREEEKMKTPIVLKNKHLANASMNESQNSYELTPDKIFVPATETNYGVEDLDSGDETDDENNPRKKVPKWASQPQLGRTISYLRHSPPFDPDVFFGPIIEPDLNLIFKPSTKYPKRTSSAMWNSPLSNPTHGKSRFFNH